MSSNKRNDKNVEKTSNEQAKNTSKSNYRGSNKRRPNRFRSGERNDTTERDNRSASTSSLNDLSWYTHNKRMAEAASKVAFTNYPGRTIELGSYNEITGTARKPIKRSYPGIWTINYIPSPGYTEDGTDPATVTGNKLYSAVREKFSGTLKADGTDMFMWIMACDSMLSYLAYLRRIYGILNLYRGENAYYPDGMLRAMGFSTESIKALKANKMQFFGELSRLASQLGMLTLPKRFDIFMRHYWLNERFYTDAPEIGSQIYLFNPVGFYYFSDYSEQTGSSLVYTPLITATMGNTVVSDLIAYGDAMFDAFQKSESCWDIYGYFQKAFEGEPMITVGQIDYGYEAQVVYEPEVLLSIHNARACIGTVIEDSLKITQDPTNNSVVFKPTMLVTDSDFKLFRDVNPYLDLMVSSPDDSVVLLASRLHTIAGTATSASGGYTCSIIAGTEIVTAMAMTTNSVSDPTTFDIMPIDQFYALDLTNNNMAAVAYPAILGDVSTFDWHPVMWTAVLETKQNNVVTHEPTMVSDIYNFATITKSQLEQIHRVCVYSEFDVYTD